MRRYFKENGLQDALNEKGVSVETLAFRLKKPNYLIRDIIGGRIIPTYNLAVEIAKCLDVPVDTLFNKKNYPNQ